MTKVPVSPPSGFRDFLPEEAATRASLIDTISHVYRGRGFQPIGMSMLENLSTLQGKGGGADNEKLIFKVLKRGDELVRAQEAGGKELADLGLRFDLTLPLARYFARFREQLPKPFKVFQIGPVWRADRPQKGRFREFFQCDVDIVGAKDLGAEVDCIGAILEVFAAAGLPGVEVHLNDRALLNSWREQLGISPESWGSVMIAFDKLDKVGLQGVQKEIHGKDSLSESERKAAADVFGLVCEKISDEPFLNSYFRALNVASMASLNEIRRLLQAEFPAVKVMFNPTLIRGQDYYTGTIFEIRHPELAGSLGGGGRYNRLLEIFGGAETPAFGGSIGFERLCLLLEGKNAPAARPQVFFPLFGEALRGPVLELAASLRREGLSVDVYPDADKLKNQFKYADDRGIPFTVIVGDQELASGEFKVKSMADRAERAVGRTVFVQRMKELCKP